MSQSQPFWKTKSLREMSGGEWESLCDGCGKCCLHKLQDEKTGDVTYTAVACRLLDCDTIQCTRYQERKKYVPDCVQVTPDNIHDLTWLPDTCAYRLVAAGDDLPWWHHLVSGNRETIHRAGMSMRGRCVREQEAGPLEDYILTPELED